MSETPAAVECAGVGVWRAQRGGQRVRLLTGIDWTVRAGERWAVVGPNGAGKSTLLAIAAAAAFPSEGRATILGERLGATDMRVLRERIGVVDSLGAGAFRTALTALEVVLTGLTGSIALRVDARLDAHRVRAEELLEVLGVASLAQRRFSLLSRGERQRVLLARAAVGRPHLLLLDEPTEGLDLVGRELFLAALDGLAAHDPRLACVQVSHHLEDLARGTDHVLLLRAGRAVACGPMARVLSERSLSRCFSAPVRLVRSEGRVFAWLDRADGVRGGA